MARGGTLEWTPGPDAKPVQGHAQAVEDMREWVTWLQASGTPTTTIGLRRYYVVRLIRHFPNRELRTLTTSDLLAWLAAQNWSPNTRKAARSALRNFYGWLAHTERIPRSPALELPVIRVPRARPKPTPEDVYREALATDDARARLAIRLAGQCGLRRGEICKVRGDDIAQTPSGPSLRVVGKGGHARDVPLPEDLAEEITEHGPGWLFPSPSARGGHLTPHHLAKIVTAALGGEACTHSLRHRAATMAYAGTRDLRAVQELLGHSRPETTAGYVLAPDDTIRAAMMAAAR